MISSRHHAVADRRFDQPVHLDLAAGPNASSGDNRPNRTKIQCPKSTAIAPPPAGRRATFDHAQQSRVRVLILRQVSPQADRSGSKRIAAGAPVSDSNPAASSRACPSANRPRGPIDLQQVKAIRLAPIWP